MTMTTATLTARAQNGGVRDGDPAARPVRRRFTSEYKLAILAEYEQLADPGSKGALLRREGLYSSHIVEWRRAKEVEGLRTLCPDLSSGSVVHRRRRVISDAGVPVLVVVEGEERLAERPGVLDRAEPLGERRAVLEGLEPSLAVGVVVAHVRPAVAPVDAQAGEQVAHGLGGHRRAAIGVDGQLSLRHLVAGDGLGDHLLGEVAG